MKKAKAGDFLKWKGKLSVVVGTSEGRVVYIQPVNATVCPTCGEIEEAAIVETSALFQENAEPVSTLISHPLT